MSCATMDLATMLIKEHFGDAVEETCRPLLKRSSLTLQELAQERGGDVKEIHEHLMLLLQHQIVRVSQKNAQPQYSADIDRILLRMRFPRLTSWVDKTIGSDGCYVFEELIGNGRLPLVEIIHQAQMKKATAGNRPYKGDPVERKILAGVAMKLIVDGYIVHVSMFNSTDLGTRRRKVGQSGDDNYDLHVGSRSTSLLGKRKMPSGGRGGQLPEMRALSSSMNANGGGVGHFRRKIVSVDDGDDDGNDDIFDDSYMPDCQVKWDKESLEAEGEKIMRRRDMYFMINFERFTEVFRNHLITTHISQSVDGLAGDIVGICLDLCRTTISTAGVEAGCSAFVEKNAVISKYNEGRSEGNKLRHDTLREHILKMQQAGVIKQGQNLTGGEMCVCVDAIVKTIKRDHIETIIRRKHGQYGKRIFRILTMFKMLEQKQIAEHAVLPAKECRQVLYAMLRDKYLGLQEVPRSNDRVPSRTIFLWKVDYDSTVAILTSEIIKTIWNVKMRYKREMKVHNEVIKTYDTNPDSLTEAQEAQIAVVKVVFERLDLLMCELDKAVMILRDF